MKRKNSKFPSNTEHKSHTISFLILIHIIINNNRKRNTLLKVNKSQIEQCVNNLVIESKYWFKLLNY